MNFTDETLKNKKFVITGEMYECLSNFLIQPKDTDFNKTTPYFMGCFDALIRLQGVPELISEK